MRCGSAEWRNWQTRRTQNPVPARACRFESDLGYPTSKGLTMSKLSEYVQKEELDLRRVLAISKARERLRPEDRAIRLARKRLRRGDQSAKQGAAPKPRSGRPVSASLLRRALAGGTISGASKTRITRAVNAVLANKGKKPAQLRDLF